jgi:hypothetical protein
MDVELEEACFASHLYVNINATGGGGGFRRCTQRNPCKNLSDVLSLFYYNIKFTYWLRLLRLL